MTGIAALVLEVEDATAAEAFYKEAFDLGDTLRVRASQAPTSGFRGFTVSLVVSQPSTVDTLVRGALDAGATEVKPVKKSFWGYGGVVQAPDGTLWKVASSSKKDTGPATREVDEVVLLLGVEDVKATKQFYVDRGLAAGQELRQQVRRVRHARLRGQARALPAQGRGQGRRGRRRGLGVPPARRHRRRRGVHGPGRVRLGVGLGLTPDPLPSWAMESRVVSAPVGARLHVDGCGEGLDAVVLPGGPDLVNYVAADALAPDAPTERI